MERMLPVLLVGTGGFVGSVVRYLLGTWISTAFGARFPLGTFVINVTGAFVLGVVGTVVGDRLVRFPDELRLLVGIGFLGGYTTFSTFAMESHALLEDGEWLRALVNLVGSPLLGVLAAHLGVMLVRRGL